jgi:hypothetical protein
MEIFGSARHELDDSCQWNENQHLIALFEWARGEIYNGRRSLRMLSAIPNGRGFVTKKCVDEYEKYGFRRGLPDILYLWPSRRYHGLAIELKSMRGNARVSTAQLEVIRDLSNAGYCAEVCYGYKDAIKTIDRYDNDL